MATQEIINIGTLPNDGEGDPLRVAFAKINNNFSNLFATFVNTSDSYSVGNTAGQIIFETSANAFTMGEVFIYTADPGTNNSQTIQLFAQLNQAKDDVKFTGYGSTFFGNALSTYDMAVVGGNIQILANPLGSETLFHFIGSQNLWMGANVMGLFLELDGYTNTSVVSTENDLIISTEQGA
jgi:hypothetical protein